jgi:hypothetical protein
MPLSSSWDRFETVCKHWRLPIGLVNLGQLILLRWAVNRMFSIRLVSMTAWFLPTYRSVWILDDTLTSHLMTSWLIEYDRWISIMFHWIIITTLHSFDFLTFFRVAWKKIWSIATIICVKRNRETMERRTNLLFRIRWILIDLSTEEYTSCVDADGHVFSPIANELIDDWHSSWQWQAN